MIVDEPLGAFLLFALFGSFLAITTAFFGGDKTLRKPLIVSALILPVIPFVFSEGSEELYCSSFESGLQQPDKSSSSEIKSGKSKSFPDRLELNIYQDFRAYWLGGPAGKNIDFSDVRGNFKDNQYGDIADWNSLSYASWTGGYTGCEGSFDCLIYADYAPKRHNLSMVKKGAGLDDWTPLPTEGDLLILSSTAEYAFYDCVNLD